MWLKAMAHALLWFAFCAQDRPRPSKKERRYMGHDQIYRA